MADLPDAGLECAPTPRVAYRIVSDPSTPSGPTPDDARWIRCDPLHGDASCRRYARLVDRAGRTAVVVRYPAAETSGLVRDLEVVSWLRTRGVRVPAVLATGHGWALLEDLGPEDAEGRLARTASATRAELAGRLLEPLAALARIPPAELPRWNEPLDAGRLRWELAGFELWYVRYVLGMTPPAGLGSWLDELAEEVGGHPVRVCHRDYHLNNLFFGPRGDAVVIDVQDARIGPDTYDLVSLLEERAAPCLLGAADRSALRETWRRATDPRPGWVERYRSVRWQRGLKVLGTFARLVAGGRTEYATWLDAARRGLAADADRDRVPPAVTALLVDSAEDGGRNAR